MKAVTVQVQVSDRRADSLGGAGAGAGAEGGRALRGGALGAERARGGRHGVERRQRRGTARGSRAASTPPAPHRGPGAAQPRRRAHHQAAHYEGVRLPRPTHHLLGTVLQLTTYTM